MPFVLGLLEREYKENINCEEGIKLIIEALKSSTQRDTGSGYGIDVFKMKDGEIEHVIAQEIIPEYKDQLGKKRSGQ